jgi:hypothetical protein
MLGLYITIAILLLTVLMLLSAMIAPKLKKYRLVIKPVEPKRKRRPAQAKKKRKSVWIRVI